LAIIIEPGMSLSGVIGAREHNKIPRLSRRRLTTAEILYHLPDHPGLLQSFTWQCLDRAPNYPRLTQLLDYWSHNLDATLHSVRVMQAGARPGPGVRTACWHQLMGPQQAH